MKLKILAILTLFMSVHAFAETEETDIVPYTDEKGVARWLAEGQAKADAEGKPSPKIIFPDRNSAPPEDAFEFPSDQMLPNCFYDRGYNFPTQCFAGKTLIFHAERDSQGDLEKLKKKYGKIDPKYNQIPPNFHEQAAQMRKEVGLPDFGSDEDVSLKYELVPEYTDYRSKEDKERQAKLGK